MLAQRTFITTNGEAEKQSRLMRIGVALVGLVLTIGAIVIVWGATGRHYSQLLAFAATIAFLSMSQLVYQFTITSHRGEGSVLAFLIAGTVAMLIFPEIDASLLAISVVLAMTLSVIVGSHFGTNWGYVFSIASAILLLGENLIASALSTRVFGNELGQEFAQSGIPIYLIIPTALGLMTMALQVLVQYEATLAREKSTTRILIDNLPDHVFVKDTESRIVINNTMHARLLGNSTPDQVVGKNDFDFFSRDLAQQYFDSEQQLIHSGEARFTIEEPTIDPNGNKRWLLTTKVIVRNVDDKPVGLVGISRDITDLKQAEHERDSLLHAEQSQKQTLETLVKHIGEVVRQMNEVVNTILNISQQQTSSMVEQEASVTETMATVEELRATVKSTADLAKGVAIAADNSITVSRSGEESVSDAIQGMSNMKQRVENIAENILTLSERTQQIDEIIGTVNALAEQSKLLALNASIEAARAGNEGRGFAVVAMEVRQLAEQSRDATARIRAILTEIQQATNTAVMVTEEGSKQAERGMTIVEEAGKAIQNLETVIGESAQSAQQIAGSTHQQMIGMEQLSIAIANIRQATTQTVSNTRLMENNVQALIEMSTRLEQAAEEYHS